MQLTMFDLFDQMHRESSSGKMSPESSPQRTTPSAAFLAHLPGKMIRSSHQGANGRTQVVCMVPKEQLRGESSTPNISEWPNDAAVCLLSQVLETTLIPQRFFLSSTACAGILRRAEKRGKSLPPSLHAALQAVASGGGKPGQGYPAVLQPIAFHPTQDPISSANVCHSIGANANATAAVAIGWDEELNASTEQSGTLLRGGQGGRHDGVMTAAMQVRRLTPVECERLQGFPDNYTNISWNAAKEAARKGISYEAILAMRGMTLRGPNLEECPDGPRYKALGNSWAVPNVRWIGKRIQEALNALP